MQTIIKNLDNGASAMDNEEPDVDQLDWHELLSISSTVPQSGPSYEVASHGLLEMFGVMEAIYEEISDHPNDGSQAISTHQSLDISVEGSLYEVKDVSVQHSTNRSASNNGPTAIVPKNHLSDYSPRIKDMSSKTVPCSAGLPQGNQPIVLPLHHEPDILHLHPRSFSIPSTYSSEMIRVVIGEPSTAGKVKRNRTKRRPSPFPLFRPESFVTCAVCGLVVASRGHLTRHEIIHGINQCYPCYFCECFFSRKGKLSTHLQRAHGIVPPASDKLMIVKQFEQLQMSIAENT